MTVQNELKEKIQLLFDGGMDVEEIIEWIFDNSGRMMRYKQLVKMTKEEKSALGKRLSEARWGRGVDN